MQVKEKETTIKKSDLEDKTYNDLIAEYFSEQDGESSIQDSITVLRALDKKMLSEIQLMGNSLMDVFLLSNGADDVKYLSNELYSVLRYCKIADEEVGAKLVVMCNRYMKWGKNSQKEDEFYSEILSSRRGLNSTRLETIKEKNGLYFSNALEPLEKYEKSLSILKSMLEEHNRISPDLRNRNLETKIDFLEFMVKHYDKIKEYFLEISTKLELMSKEEIEGLAKKFYLEERPTNYEFEGSVGYKRIVEGLESRSEIPGCEIVSQGFDWDSEERI